MRYAAYLLGLLVAFAGGWGAMLITSYFLMKAKEDSVMGWLALLSFLIAGALGLLAAKAFVNTFK